MCPFPHQQPLGSLDNPLSWLLFPSRLQAIAPRVWVAVLMQDR